MLSASEMKTPVKVKSKISVKRFSNSWPMATIEALVKLTSQPAAMN